MLSKNLKFIRRYKKKTQTQMAEQFNISRTTWAGYEKGTSEPNASLLKEISNFAGIKMEDIFLDNIEDAITSNNIILNNDNIRILAITVNNEGKQNIELVPIKAIAGYAQNFANPSFIGDLPKFNIPKLHEGSYRAFEVKGVSMLPINEGDIVVGRYIENVRDIRHKKRHIIILKGEDVLFKRIFNDISDKNKLILVSDNPDFIPFSVHLENVAEIWEMVLCIRYGDVIDNNDELLLQKFNQIEQKINQIIDSKH